MASVCKATKHESNALFSHYERKDGVKFSNQDIDKSRSHLNYNLAPIQNISQKEILEKRLSEVKVLKRDDVNVTCNWVVTLPKTIEKDSKEEKEFFKISYEFLENKYGKNNVISSYVHKDEITPHMHFCFIPVVIDKNKNIEKVSAFELITKKHLKEFHIELDKYINNYFNREIGILNGATANGNRTVLELKNELLQEELNNLNIKVKEIKKTQEYYKNELKDLKYIIEDVEIQEGKFLKKTIIKNITKEQFKKICKFAKENLQNHIGLSELNEKIKSLEEEKQSLQRKLKLVSEDNKRYKRKDPSNELYQKLVMETSIPKDDILNSFMNGEINVVKIGQDNMAIFKKENQIYFWNYNKNKQPSKEIPIDIPEIQNKISEPILNKFEKYNNKNFELER